MKQVLKTFAFFGLFTAMAVAKAEAQDRIYNPVLTAVPSLSIAPDARSAAMGDQGVATGADSYAQFWNPAKYAFIDSKAGITLSYTPWLSKLVSDIALMQLGGFYKLGEGDNQALGASLRYFSMGKLQKWDQMGASMGESSPHTFAVDVSYSRKLSEVFSMAVGLRYIHSDQDASGENKGGNAFAADIAGYMNKYVVLWGGESLWTMGFNIRNIGTKISNDGGVNNNFIPTNLALGTGLLYPIDEYNMIGLHVEANKFLVPTRPVKKQDESVEAYTKRLESHYGTSPIAGIFKSFGDAPGGFSEELREIRWSIGAEYNYNHKFILRAGYSYLDPTKGNLQYFTAGAGFRMSAISLDASYLVSTVQNNPLDQTLRFSLSFDMDGIRKLFQ